MLRQPGHRFFFSLAEVEPMKLPDNQTPADGGEQTPTGDERSGPS
jgi:hypothetical protein